ncbi:putative bifunctional diguanylate cyclase/phosphodiesterase [Candidatus Solirubrobacter pratensis]|uniref:putative bifunctional diguanylate cyclase/phosphodiesterase n=1 Tax=Candidatus Solirubrobacter pratensis TaxID=1298857 RepID=UPI0018CA1F11|nr:EAL domain-containing protein [Candidatus Solirubrobacter pratensis]
MWTVVQYAALAVALALVVMLVMRRLGPPSAMSWLDAAMGASSIAALAAPAGPEAAIALGGLAGVLALSRWHLRPQPPQPGPEFSPVVLTAVLTFAAIGLALLVVGQFTDILPVSAALAAVTVLTGMARAGLTVTERLRASRREAVTDDLTGLGNRRYLMARLERAIAEAAGEHQDLALLLVDLDGFKELNDTLGHHAGDEVLRQIGPRLASVLRERDTLARLGGDEFAVILRPGDEAAASAAGLRLRASLEQSFAVGGIRVHIDASVGIAMFPAHALDGLGLLQRADVAMYEAKRTRTGHEVYLPSRDRHSRERLELLGELRDALDAGELVLHYQPKAEIATGVVRGVEALVRWAHPQRGLLAPDEFLPLAEQSGLGRSLTAFVVDRALDEISASGLDLTVAVNLGPADLLDLGLPSEVDRLLRRRRFAPEQLRLEVSEDVVMADPERTLEVLRGLRAIGVATALDDFGAGHASLGHLKALQVDELKIDRQFVMHLTEDSRDQAIVHATVELGRRLGMLVVAEGVESAEAWDALAVLACDEAQGFYLGRAMPMDALPEWLGARARQTLR